MSLVLCAVSHFRVPSLEFRLMVSVGNTWRDSFDAFLTICPDAPVRSLKDLVAYNEAHAAEAMPDGTLVKLHVTF